MCTVQPMTFAWFSWLVGCLFDSLSSSIHSGSFAGNRENMKKQMVKTNLKLEGCYIVKIN